MSRFVAQIEGATAMSRTDINRVAQTILIPLLAEVYGYTELKNLDSPEEPNYPAIDLGDETARVSFQVTSTSGSEKIKKTLRKFVERELYEKYDKLIIYILTEKQDSYSGKGYEEIIQGKFTFDKDKDIWDYRDILREVANFQIDKVCKVESILEANFGEGRRLPEWEVVDKVEEVINEYTQLFVGRSEEFQKLEEFLRENSSGVKLVKAGAGFGKTALLANWVNGSRGKDCFIAYHFFSQRYDVTRSVARAYRNLLRQLYIYYELSYEQLPNDENQLRETLYSILRERGAREGKPLVIALDGLDEAERPFSPPFPTPLPENVFVIASARAEEGEEPEPEYLRGWIDSTESICLNRLSREAIAQWLRQTGEGELVAFAEDTHFVAQLDEITQGFPLYLRYLIEDLSHVTKQGQDVREVLAQMPQGFERYVKQQLKCLDELDLPDERWQFFALLAVAKGVLEKEDIKALTGMRDRNLRQLHQSWQVTRWMRITEGKLYAFAHPLLATTFATQLGDDAEDALQDLIDYCAKWEKYQSRYALRHYAEHLREEKQWEKLYVIARKQDFAVAQREYLPDEPDLPLKTVQIALQGAADTDNAGAMAEFLVANARRIIRQESPLDVLRSGNLKRALALADMYENERSVLWYLLLAWELKDKNKLEEAHTLLKQLLKKELPRFSVHFFPGKWAIYLLTQICPVDEDTFTVLYKRLLPANEYYDLCICLSSEGYLESALKTVQEIDWSRKPGISSSSTPEVQIEVQTRDTLNVNYWYQVKALVTITKAYFEAGDREAARATLTNALETAGKIDPNLNSHAGHNLAEVLQEIVSAQAQIGEFDNALQTAQKIKIEYYRIAALKVIIVAQVNESEFDIALQIAKENDLTPLEAWLFRLKARIELQAGNTETAQSNLLEALRTVDRIEDKLQQVSEIALIALVQSKLGDKEKEENIIVQAFEKAGKIEEKDIRARAIAVIAQVITELEDFERARATFAEALDYATQNITHPQQLTLVVEKIAVAQVEVGQFSEALETTKKITEQWQQANLQKTIALGQAKAKKFDLALDITSTIKERKVRSEAIGEIAIEQAQTEKPDIPIETIKAVDFIERHSIRLEIAKILYRRDYKQQSRTIFSEFLQANHTFDNQIVSVTALIDVAVAQTQVRDLQNAQHTLATAQEAAKAIEDQRFQVMALCDIAVTYIQVGDRGKAEITFDTAWQIAQRIHSRTDQSFAVEQLTKTRLSLKDFDAAFRTACSLKESIQKAAILEEIAVTHAKEGNFDTAFEVAQAISLKDYKERVLQEIKDFQVAKESLAKAKSGDVTAAFEIVQRIESLKLQAKALMRIAEVQVKRGQRKAAIATLAEALKIAKKVNEGYDTEAIEAIILTQAEIDTLPNCLESVKTIYSAYMQAEVIGRIARLKAEKRQDEEAKAAFSVALKTAQEIDSESTRSYTLGNIAKEQVQAGFDDQAIKTTKMIRTERNWQLPAIASVFVDKGDKTNFKQLLIPCSYSLYAAYRTCGLLARLYPEQVAAVAKVVSEFN
jgi:hypothetical protein